MNGIVCSGHNKLQTTRLLLIVVMALHAVLHSVHSAPTYYSCYDTCDCGLASCPVCSYAGYGRPGAVRYGGGGRRWGYNLGGCSDCGCDYGCRCGCDCDCDCDCDCCR